MYCLQWPEVLTDQEIPIIAKVAFAKRSTANERRLLIDICVRTRRAAAAEKQHTTIKKRPRLLTEGAL